MNKLTLFLFFSFAFLSIDANAQVKKAHTEAPQRKIKTGSKKSDPFQRLKEMPQGAFTSTWTMEDRQAFVVSCLSEPGLRQDSAQNYCSCMQEKIEKSYPNVAEAYKLTQEEAVEMAKACFAQISVTRSWGEIERNLFINECMNGTNKTMEQENARSYCTCLLEKLEKQFPNVFAVGNASGELLSKWAEECKNQ
jgi:hypothetical protein